MTTDLCTFTMVIPTYNRVFQLSNCLVSLAQLNYPKDRYEVIVVDDQSKETPEPLITAFCNQMDITLIVQPHRGPAAARNAGSGKAKGDYIAFIDDDCIASPDWLLELAKAFATDPEQALGGLVVNQLTSNPYAVASQELVNYVCSYFEI